MTIKKDRRLEGPDVLLNLKEICIHGMNGFSSMSFSAPAGFYFENTKHGWIEDPDLSGSIEVLSTEKEKDYYVLKVRFKKGDD